MSTSLRNQKLLQNSVPVLFFIALVIRCSNFEGHKGLRTPGYGVVPISPNLKCNYSNVTSQSATPPWPTRVPRPSPWRRALRKGEVMLNDMHRCLSRSQRQTGKGVVGDEGQKSGANPKRRPTVVWWWFGWVMGENTRTRTRTHVLIFFIVLSNIDRNDPCGRKMCKMEENRRNGSVFLFGFLM